MIRASTIPSPDVEVAVIGAGPYGLSVTRHLRKSGVSTHTFGDPMSFWRDTMPEGMLLRSAWTACNIGAQKGDLTVDAFAAANNRHVPDPVPLEDFIDYGVWYQERVVPDLDRRHVTSVSESQGGFVLSLEDGDEVRASRVVVAAGIAPFADRPKVYADMPRQLVSHAMDHTDLAKFAGRRVAVVGAGQSALESAAILHERDAIVELLVRGQSINWLRKAKGTDPDWIAAILYTPTDVGPPGLNRLVALPDVFRRLPRSTQTSLAYRAIRPAGAGWLIDRLADVPFTFDQSITSVRATAEGTVELTLSDSSTRDVDHVLLGTGYRVDVAKYPFLDADIVSRLQTLGGYPLLRRGMETNISGLHFAGAPTTWSWGPLNRFVSGTWYTGRQIAAAVAGSTRAPVRQTSDVPRVESDVRV